MITKKEKGRCVVRVFALHPGAGSDLRQLKTAAVEVRVCTPVTPGLGDVAARGRPQLCNKFKASRGHLEVLSFKERKKKSYRVQRAHGIWEAGKKKGSSRLSTPLGYIARSCRKE